MTEAQTDQSPPEPRYDFDGIDLESGSVHADVVQLVGSGKRVLELGPATGYMSRVFAEHGCTVIGIEIDPAMAERAGEFCERVIVGDLDTLDLDAELGEERFDAIVAADVLEHLKDPLAALTRLKPFLDPAGSFVLSIPNIAHGSVRLALLSGNFTYRDIGLLDATHLRFFTRETIEKLLDESELGLADLRRHELNLDASEVSFDRTKVSPEVLEQLERDPDARTYQYVLKALPMPREGLRELQRRLGELIELRGAAGRVEVLERTLAEIGSREGDLRRALIEANDQLLRRDAEFVGMQEEAGRRDEEIRSLHAEVLRLRVRIEGIESSTPVRAYAVLKKLPGVRMLQRRRQARYEAELAKRSGQSS